MLTHKEMPHLNDARDDLNNLIISVKKKYLIGVHYGWHAPNIPIPRAVDFIMASPPTLQAIQSEKPGIPLISRDFIPTFFGNSPDREKFWDIICISHNSKKKKLDDFLRCMRLVMDKQPNTKILLVSAGPQKQKEPQFYAGLRQDYLTLFSDAERENFCIIDYRRERNELYALSYQAVPWLLESSRIFMLFSEIEGGSKIISEALTSGTPVFARKNLVGGGLDHLNEKNSYLFEDVEDAASALLQKLETQWSFDQKLTVKKLREDHTKPKLNMHLAKTFAHYDVPFEKETLPENLARKLPAHENKLPSSITNKFTDDLNSRAAFIIYFKEFLLNEKISAGTKILLNSKMFFYKNLRQIALNIYRQGRRILRNI